MEKQAQTSTALLMVGSFFVGAMFCRDGLDVLPTFGVDAGDEGPGVDDGQEHVGDMSRDVGAGSLGASLYSTCGLMSSALSVVTVASAVDELSSSLSPLLRRATKTHAKTVAPITAKIPVESAAIATLLKPSDSPSLSSPDAAKFHLTQVFAGSATLRHLRAHLA